MRGLWILALMVLPLAVMQAQPSARGHDSRRRDDSSAFSERMSRDGASTSSLGSAFRQYMLEELKNVPTLETSIRDILNLQQRRLVIQRRKRQYAEDSGESSEIVWQQFHQLLREEDALTSRQQEITSIILENADKIQTEIARRRQQVAQQLDQTPDEQDSREFGNYMERRRLQRVLNFYDFVSDSLTRMKADPQEQAWVKRIMLGVWPPDTLDAQAIEQARRRVNQLAQEQQDLRHRMQQIDESIRELRELLETVVPAAKMPPRKRERPPGDSTPSKP